MLSQFYRSHYRHLLLFVACTMPLFWWQAEQLKSNNDVETWLPKNTPAREVYEQFKRDFGNEDVLLLGFEAATTSPELIEAVAGRIERLAGIRLCYTPGRLISQMENLGVEQAEANRRLTGLLVGADGRMAGIIAVLSAAGTRDRAGVVRDCRAVIDYCRIPSDTVAITGAPVIVTELDRLGDQKTNRRFFVITVAICFGLLYLSLRHLGLALSIVGAALWGIYLTQAVIMVCGGEMNFILGSLSVLVMIFTLSIAVHVVGYYTQALDDGAADPLASAIKDSLSPCLLSTLTTLLGLISLNVSNMAPVSQFGYASALGSVVAMFVGLGVTPALLMVWPDGCSNGLRLSLGFGAWADFVRYRRVPLLGGSLVLMLCAAGGLTLLQSDINPVEFLPKNSPVLTDLKRVERGLTNVDSIEAVVDFGYGKQPFLERLEAVREIEKLISSQRGVRHVVSLASFFPIDLPSSPFALGSMLSKAQASQGAAGLTAHDHSLWRLSIRVENSVERPAEMIYRDLMATTQGLPIEYTGMTPLLECAQAEIFSSFWQSFTAACLTITLVMILALRSIVTGLIAMVPNIVPIWLIFGAVGYCGMPVDIGMMMTGSIALGISVDCTFHFLVHYRQSYQSGLSSAQATKVALEHSGGPMLTSTLISSAGMLALCLSSFAPTARFGWMMSLQMMASVLGELVILPALLCCRPSRRAAIAVSEIDAVVEVDAETVSAVEPQSTDEPNVLPINELAGPAVVHSLAGPYFGKARGKRKKSRTRDLGVLPFQRRAGQ